MSDTFELESDQVAKKVVESQQMLEYDDGDGDNSDSAVADDQGGDEADLRPRASVIGIDRAATQGAAVALICILLSLLYNWFYLISSSCS